MHPLRAVLSPSRRLVFTTEWSFMGDVKDRRVPDEC